MLSDAKSDALVSIGVVDLAAICALHGNKDENKHLLSIMPKDKGGNNRLIGNKVFNDMINKCMWLTSIPGNPPSSIDCQNYSNPYEKRFGQDWKREIKKSRTHRGYCCVCEIVEHFVEVGKAFFVGTEFENFFLPWCLEYYDRCQLPKVDERKGIHQVLDIAWAGLQQNAQLFHNL